MPLYEVEWTEVVKHKAAVLIPSDDKALEGCLVRSEGRTPEIVDWVKADNNPIISNGKTEITVTALGRVTEEGVKPL